MKSKEKLKSFIEYCKNHPDERFWQALRNWANQKAIYVTKELDDAEEELIDTFYWE